MNVPIEWTPEDAASSLLRTEDMGERRQALDALSKEQVQSVLRVLEMTDTTSGLIGAGTTLELLHQGRMGEDEAMGIGISAYAQRELHVSNVRAQVENALTRKG